MAISKAMAIAIIEARRRIPCMVGKSEVDLGRQGYKYASISEVKAAVVPALNDCGLGFSMGVVPGSCKFDWTDIKTKNGMVSQLLFTCEYQMTLTCVEDGSTHTENWPGLGLDAAGEKAPGIAASYALRTWLTNTLMIPIWEEEPEQRHNEPSTSPTKAPIADPNTAPIPDPGRKNNGKPPAAQTDAPDVELRQQALDMLDPHVTSGRMSTAEAKIYYDAIGASSGLRLQAYVHVANRYSDPAYRWRTSEQATELGKICKDYEAKGNKSAFTEALRLITGQALVTVLSQAEAEIAISRLR